MTNNHTLCTLRKVGAEGEAMTNLNNKKWLGYINFLGENYRDGNIYQRTFQKTDWFAIKCTHIQLLHERSRENRFELKQRLFTIAANRGRCDDWQ